MNISSFTTNLMNTSDSSGFTSSDHELTSGIPTTVGRGGSSRYRGRSRPCGYCDTSCIYNSIEMGFIIGILANIIVVYRVCMDKKLRDPTFIAIACLALADALFLTLNLARSFDDVILTINCAFPSKLVTKPYYVMQSVTWFAANSHVSMMAILRYITIAYPLKSMLILTARRVILGSVFVWILGFILIGTFTVLISYEYILPGRSQEFVIILWTIVYLMPVCVTTILHIMKLCVVKRATLESATEATKQSIRRMSKIVIMVIVFAMTLPLPRLLGKFFRATGVQYPSKDFGTHYTGIADLLFLINHFINPIMYGFLSKKFRNSIKEMLWFVKFKTSEGSTDTSDTPVTSRRTNISMDTLPTTKGSMDSVNTVDIQIKQT